MIEVTLPHGRQYAFHTAVFDYNGTLAADGLIAAEVKGLLAALAERLRVVVVTADTFGLARDQLQFLPVELVILGAGEDGAAKAAFVEKAVADGVVAIGNGVNDKGMFMAAALSICILGPEGASVPTLLAADIAVPDPAAAIGLLLHPRRLVATLRR
jgi:soluble P-type ATPase